MAKSRMHVNVENSDEEPYQWGNTRGDFQTAAAIIMPFLHYHLLKMPQ
jgi:hypothetical protein